MKNLFLTILLFGTIIWIGCNPIYYIPTTHNVPILKEKGDIRAGIYLGGNSGNGVEGCAAYAVQNHFGVLLNGGKYKVKNDEMGDGGGGKFFEGGAGYYTQLNKHFQFEVYGLLGYGALENHFPSTLADYPFTTGKLSTELLRYGVQPSLSFSSRYIDVSFSSRIASLNYFNTKGNLTFGMVDQQQFLKDRKSHFLIEPALTLRLGYNPIKLQIQIGGSANLSHNDFKQDQSFLTLGIVCIVPSRKGKI